MILVNTSTFLRNPVITLAEVDPYTLTPIAKKDKSYIGLILMKWEPAQCATGDERLSPFYTRENILELGLSSGCSGGKWIIEYPMSVDPFVLCEKFRNTLDESKWKLGESIDVRHGYKRVPTCNMLISTKVIVYNRDFRNTKEIDEIASKIIEVLDPEEMYYKPDIFNYLDLDEYNDIGIDVKLHKYSKKNKSWI